MEELLVSLPLLKDLDSRGNPVCKASSRYRETAVLASHPSLGEQRGGRRQAGGQAGQGLVLTLTDRLGWAVLRAVCV